jgi:AraC-like DNA-binding protein
MSRSRQAVPATEAAIAVRSLALRLPAGHALDAHAHPWAQLVYATEGTMTVTAERGTWVVPSNRALWVPAGVLHELRTTTRVRLRTLYVRPDLARRMPRACRVLAVSPLLRELVLEVLRLGMLRDDDAAQLRLARVVLDQVRVTPEAPFELPWPRDPRARRVAQRVLDDLAAAPTLDELADGSGASVRTLERLFVRDTRRTFAAWRQQARLLHALKRLAAGDSVTAVGAAVGFASTSAFVSMFQRALGRTPGRWFADE